VNAEAAGELEWVLAEEQISVSGRNAPAGGRVWTVRQALFRGDVLLLSAQYFFWSLGVYGFMLWLPTVVQLGSRLSMGRTGLLSSVPYVLEVALMMAASFLSDKTQRRKTLVWPFLLAAGAALLGSFLFAERSFALAFAFLVIGGGCMYAPYGPFFAIVPERLPRNVTAEVLAMINSCGALGGFVGTYFVGWLRAVTGNSRAGFLLMSVSLVCSAMLMLCLKPLESPDGTQAITMGAEG